MNKLVNTNYDDKVSRKKVKEFLKETFNIVVECNSFTKEIDLINEDIGVEIEHGNWLGDFWSNKNYSMKAGLDFPTINIPKRKEKYWLEYYTWYGRKYHNPNYDKNLYVRTNKDFTQIILIRPEVIRDHNKVIRTLFKASYITNGKVEEWLSFRKSDVETYNLVDGKYILES